MSKKIKATIVTGFLEAGKTSYIYSCLLTLPNNSKKPLLLSFEQGEISYDDFSSKCDVILFDDINNLNEATLKEITARYEPEEIYIEVNGMMSTKAVLENIPDNWYLNDIVALFDSSTFLQLMSNYGNLITEKIKYASYILFNRATDTLIDKIREKNIQLVNPIHNIYFQTSDQFIPYISGSMHSIWSNTHKLEISDSQYLSWYTDSLNYSDSYIGRKISICGFLRDNTGLPKDFLIIERDYIYCCKDDMLFLKIYCHGKTDLSNDTWVKIEGTIIQNDNPFLDKPYYIQLDSILSIPEIIDSVIY